MAAKREIALAGIEVCDMAMELGGGPAFFKGSPIERAYRDIRAIKFHPLSPEGDAAPRRPARPRRAVRPGLNGRSPGPTRQGGCGEGRRVVSGDSAGAPQPMAWRPVTNPYEPVRVLSDDHVEQIHLASLRLLAGTGMRVLDAAAHATLRGRRVRGRRHRRPVRPGDGRRRRSPRHPRSSRCAPAIPIATS